MYEIWAKATFSAAHLLEGYDGCCSNIHGHNWTVKVWVDVEDHELDSIGIGVDMSDLKSDLKALLEPLDHALLTNSNTKLKLKDESYKVVIFNPNPTAETIAKWVYHSLDSNRLDSGNKYNVARVEVLEGENSGVRFYGWG